MDEVTIGDCRLILGDCRNVLPTLILQNMDAVCITDPPYIIQGQGGGIGAKRAYTKSITDSCLEEGFDESCLDYFDTWFIFCGKQQLSKMIAKAEEKNRWMLLTWNKANPTPLSNGNYLPDTEYMIHNFVKHDYIQKKRFIHGNVEKNSFDHPTVKPQYVMQFAIESASHRNDLIIDPFMGTASTGIAAINMGRKFIGVEKERKYFDIAVERIKQAYAQPRLFADEPARKPEQQTML